MHIAQEVGLKRVLKHVLFTGWHTVFNLLPFSPLRVWWLKTGGAQVGTNTIIDSLDFINLDRTGLSGLTIGDRCFLGRGVLLDLAGKITLKGWVTVSPRVIILSHINVGFSNHPLLKTYPPQLGHTIINSGCFIGAGSIILAGINIGAKSLVGAGAVVTKPIRSGSVAVGVPAKIDKQLKL